MCPKNQVCFYCYPLQVKSKVAEMAHFFSEEPEKIYLSNPLRPVRKNKMNNFCKKLAKECEVTK